MRRNAKVFLPFAPGDATAGTENELQAVVCGTRSQVDLPLSIESSRYYANILRRAAAGETPSRAVAALEQYLSEKETNVWENSWIRFPLRKLSRFAQETVERDLLADKRSLSRGAREDRARFVFERQGETFLRVPVSYLIKLALADFSASSAPPRKLQDFAACLMKNFLCDLISPETFSFYVIKSVEGASLGRMTAGEMVRRFLFTHLLVEWANKRFALEESGQRARVYFAPNTPVRQKELNDCVPDAFFRELLINPCLSGWDEGERKRDYMNLCHQVTSRSQLNAIAKLREAGIIVNNLIALPNASNVSLSNNGTHLSLGSRSLTAKLADNDSSFTAIDEKRIGDLVIKISEHFLPLFVVNYTAAPRRFAFDEMHPEIALGFLPHELDFTHLRMLWRQWKKKADINIFNRPRTPYGPKWIDETMARLFRLRGDFIPDVRLVDYPVAWLATEGASALDGATGNAEQLKIELEEAGVSDRRMKLYQLISLREFARVGFSGFEGRHYSLFKSFFDDFAPAADLQQLITMLAYRYALEETYTHEDLPDDPTHESERRQAIFCAALGVPVFYVHTKSRNKFLRRIVEIVRNSPASKSRISRRHAKHLRVRIDDYLRALVELIEQDAADLVETLNMRETIADLRERLHTPELRVSVKLLRGTLDAAGAPKYANPLKIEAREFNCAAEKFYREDLRRRHLAEAFKDLREHFSSLSLTIEMRAALCSALGERDALSFLNSIKDELLGDALSTQNLRALLTLTLAAIHDDARRSDELLAAPPMRNDSFHDAKVYSPIH